MSLTGTSLERALGLQPSSSPCTERPQSSQSLFSWPAVSIGLMVVVGCGAIASLGIAMGAVVRSDFPTKASLALSSLYLWKLNLGARLLHINGRIIVVNCVAALLFATFGTLTAMMESSLRSRHRSYDRLESMSGRPLAIIASWFFPRLKQLTDPIARETAALALVFPFLALGANGAVIGILLGTAAWTGPHELATSLKLFLPHGIIELPVLLVAASIGIANGITLVHAGQNGSLAIAAAGRQRLRSKRLWIALAAVFALLVVAGLLEPTGNTQQSSNPDLAASVNYP